MPPQSHWGSHYSLHDDPATNDLAACARKVRFSSKAFARERARQIARTGTKLWPYECPACGAWHLTSTPPDVERRRRRT